MPRGSIYPTEMRQWCARYYLEKIATGRFKWEDFAHEVNTKFPTFTLKGPSQNTVLKWARDERADVMGPEAPEAPEPQPPHPPREPGEAPRGSGTAWDGHFEDLRTHIARMRELYNKLGHGLGESLATVDLRVRLANAKESQLRKDLKQHSEGSPLWEYVNEFEEKTTERDSVTSEGYSD